MKLTTACLLSVAVAGLYLGGCEGDQSAPSRPRTKAILPANQKNQDDAWKRENEAPNRNMPTAGPETPGQSCAGDKSGGSMLTLGDMYGTNFHGPLPQLPEKPGMTPTAGYTPVPGTPWVIEHSWGETQPLAEYPHRAWADTKTEYLVADVKHNPTYAYDFPLSVPKPKCEAGADAVSTLVAVPWFYCTTVALPVLMCFEPPLKQQTAARLGQDPLYFGYLPKSGAIVPSPSPGEFKFDYDFSGTATQPTTMPAN